MKRKVNVWDYAGKIMEEMGKGILLTTARGDEVNSMTIGWGTIGQSMKKGILLTAKADGKVNTMTIGWGTIGIEWLKPIFTVYVRESRYTKSILEETGEFTINVPLNGCDKNILTVCGTKSGRDMDKIKELGLTLEAPEVISVPAIKELPLTLECKVIYKQDQDPAAIAPENDLDPDEDMDIAGEASMNFDSEVRAVVLSCENKASVTVSKRGGGGIAGRMALGLVKSCTNTDSTMEESPVTIINCLPSTPKPITRRKIFIAAFERPGCIPRV